MIENNYEGDEHKDLRIELKSGHKEKPHPIEIVTGENVAAIENYLVERLKAIAVLRSDLSTPRSLL